MSLLKRYKTYLQSFWRGTNVAFLVKALILSEDLKTRTAGVVFLGTPHRGSQVQNHAMTIATIAAMGGIGDRSALLEVVQKDSEMLKDIIRDFTAVAIYFDIQLCCFEQRNTDIAAVVRPRFLSFWPYLVRHFRHRPCM